MLAPKNRAEPGGINAVDDMDFCKLERGGLRRLSVAALAMGAACSADSLAAPEAVPGFVSNIGVDDGARHATKVSVRIQSFTPGRSVVQHGSGLLYGTVVHGREKAHGEIRVNGSVSRLSLGIIRRGARLIDRLEEFRDSTGARWTVQNLVSRGGRQVRTEIRREGELVGSQEVTYSAGDRSILLSSRQTVFRDGTVTGIIEYVVDDIADESEFSPAAITAVAMAARVPGERPLLHGVTDTGTEAVSHGRVASVESAGPWCILLAVNMLAAFAAVGPACAPPQTMVTCLPAINVAALFWHEWEEECAPKAT